MRLLRSALKFLLLATGEAVVYPRFALCSEWDSCAPHAVLQGAGGDIFEWKAEASTGEPGEPLRYCKDSVLNPFFVAVGALRGSKAPPLPREKTE